MALAILWVAGTGGVAWAQAPLARLETGPDCAALDAVRAAPEADWTAVDDLQRTEAERSPGGDSIWLRLASSAESRRGSAAEVGRVTIAMPSNRAVRLVSYDPPAYLGDTLDAADPRAWLLSFRHLGRELAPHPDGPIYLCFAGPALGADELEVVPAYRFRERDLAATQWRALAFGVIVAMSLFSALFYVALREFVFIKYLGFLLSFLLYLACETRVAHRLPLFSALDVAGMIRLNGMAIDLASGLAFLFALEFANLHRLAPRLARVLRWIALALFPLMLAHGGAFLLESAALVNGTIRASNLLVGGGGMILLAAVAIAAGRRDRYARFYLVGWTPLVLTAFTASTQQLVWGRTATATIDMMLIAGAFESVVLALGLADRTLTYRRELDRARELADRDALSGLLNRRALVRLANALDAESLRRGGSLSVAMFDLDHFKQVNDRYGHLAGDACIRAFAEHLQAEVRRADLAARYGGEEFVTVLPGASNEAALALAERVRSRVERAGAQHEAQQIALTVSVGVAAGGADEGVSRLLERADRALYAAKSAGRNRVVADLPRT